MFLSDRSTPLLLSAHERARALDSWRNAARVVSTRWEVFLEAEPESRAWAFASYVAALDAEEAAANDIAGLLQANAA